MNRAYSILEIKSIDDDARTFDGIATTPNTDRMEDIVDPMGAVFKLPFPMLWQHGKGTMKDPVGAITGVKVGKDGISVKGYFAKVDSPPSLKDDFDRAWALVKLKLVRGLSIGFNSLASEPIKGSFGTRYTKWEWLELSPVTIAANSDASIQTIKAIDQSQRAATGHTPGAVVRLDKPPPGVSGTPNQPASSGLFVVPKGKEMNISEQISTFQTKRTATSDRMAAIMNAAADKGETLDDSAKEEYDTLASEQKAIDEHVVRLKAHEAAQIASAKEVPQPPSIGKQIQTGGVVSVRRNLIPGAAFTRYAMVLAHSKGNLMQAEVLARRFDDTTPEVGMAIKAAVAAGTTQDTTWAAPLVQLQDMQAEFIEFLRPMTLLGRIPGLRRVPFNIKFTRQTAGTTGTFVGEGLPKPLGKMDFEQLTLTWAKAATIIVMTQELVRFSSPSAEALARDDLAAGIAKYLDMRFIDPSFAGVANVSPASITNGVTPIASSGTTIAAIDTDVEAAVAGFVTGNLDVGGLVWLMNPRTALSLSMKRHTDGNKAYPGLNAKGGEFEGYPVITSNNVSLTGSPTDTFVVLLDPSEIMLADDGGVTIDMSSEASVEMSNTPTGGATSLVSLWQNNLVGLRAERFINWRKRRDAAVAIISEAAW